MTFFPVLCSSNVITATVSAVEATPVRPDAHLMSYPGAGRRLMLSDLGAQMQFPAIATLSA